MLEKLKDYLCRRGTSGDPKGQLLPESSGTTVGSKLNYPDEKNDENKNKISETPPGKNAKLDRQKSEERPLPGLVGNGITAKEVNAALFFPSDKKKHVTKVGDNRSRSSDQVASIHGNLDDGSRSRVERLSRKNDGKNC